jgi:hypothetical protein
VKQALSLAKLEQRYIRWRKDLSKLGYLSQGSVQDRTARPDGGAGYQWTRKVAGKTVTVALTKDQFQQMKQAVQNKRRLTSIIRIMEKISRQIIFKIHPHPDRRKHLSPRVLGTK